MKWLRTKRGMTVVVVLLLALFLIRPGANRLRTRIVNSISLALGRPVEVAYVRIHVLPRPGFDLENFLVHDDPAFGAEPMLRASDVSASLRLRSLLRGRLEISRLSLTEPSLNLVRNSEGHWNLEALLQRSAQIQVAPTSKSPTETRPGFPYIEASRGRINFKFGAEKKPYTLTNADFSLWQDSENTWGTRLQAEPVRTDFNLTDTGVIHVAGFWQRAPNLGQTPLQFSVVWERAQLGQLTKLAYGNDKGWRGSLKLAATLSGTPANLAVKTELSAGDFHRYDIVGNGGLRLAAQCSAHYSSFDKMFTDIACHAPGLDGPIRLEGTLGDPFESRSYDITIAMQGMSVQPLVTFAHYVTRLLPDDLTTTGQVDAELKLRRGGKGKDRPIEWTGGGEISDLRLTSPRSNGDLELGSIPFALVSEATPTKRASRTNDTFSPVGRHLQIGPFRWTAGRPNGTLVRGWMTSSGYSLDLQGDGQVQRLMQAARVIGLPTVATPAEGTAKIDLQFAGDWWGVVAPRVMGKAQLHSVVARMRGWNAPLEISTADVSFLPNEIDVKNGSATVAGTAWHGWLTIPRPCGITGACAMHFDLHADEIALNRVNQLLNPSAEKQPWYHFLSSDSGTPYLLTANAMGKLAANRVVIHNLAATSFSAEVELKSGRLRLSEMRADLLGGKHSGELTADFTHSPARYEGSGRVQRLSLGQLAKAMHDGWVTGVADAAYKTTASGISAADLYSSASGTLQLEAWDAALPHILLPEDTTALQVHHLTTSLLLHDEKFEIQSGQLETAAANYQLSGTASWSRALNLRLAREGSPGFAITGTLAEPRVAEMTRSETQAALKP